MSSSGSKISNDKKKQIEHRLSQLKNFFASHQKKLNTFHIFQKKSETLFASYRKK